MVPSDDDDCPCRSGRKYKLCHRAEVRRFWVESFDEYLEQANLDLFSMLFTGELIQHLRDRHEMEPARVLHAVVRDFHSGHRSVGKALAKLRAAIQYGILTSLDGEEQKLTELHDQLLEAKVRLRGHLRLLAD